MAKKKLNPVVESATDVAKQNVEPQVSTDVSLDGMDPMDEDLMAVQKALEQEDSQLGDNPLGMEEPVVSHAEELARDGKSTAEVNGETIEMSEGAARRFSIFDKDGNGLFSKEEVQAVQDQIKKNNQTIGLKDDSNGKFRLEDKDGNRLDKVSGKKSVKLGKDGEDGVITYNGSNGLNHYEGPLGTFNYNPAIFAVGYKTVYDSIGGESVDSEIPVLRFVGSAADITGHDGNSLTIPKGVKNLDYTFEGIKDLEAFPVIPDGVESMHGTFKNCTELTRSCTEGKTGENTVFNSWIWNANGKGGTCVLPDSVKDLSYCFSGCTNLEEGFTVTKSSTQLENMDGYARNCKKLTTILDVSDAKFLPVTAQTDAYDGINTKMIKSIGGVAVEGKDVSKETGEDGHGVLKFGDDYAGISMYANEDSIYASGKNETNPYSVEERERLKYVKALQDYRANDRMYLADPSAVANASAGMATTATYVDKNGQIVHTTDPTKADEQSSEKSGGLFGGALGGILGGDTGQIVQRLGFGFLEYKVLKCVVKNPLVAMGITAGGQALGVLPGTIDGFGKTLTAIGGMFGKDSKFGGMISKIGDKLSGMGSSISADKDVMTKEEASNMNAIKDATQAAEAQNNALSSQALAKLNDNMAKRGAYSAEYGTFQELAEVQEGYGVFNNVRMASEDSMSAFSVALLEKQQADGGQLSEASKQELATSAKQIMQSWGTYSENASDALRATYGGNPDEKAKGDAGLAKMMRAAVTPNIEILRGLNDQYQFLSEQDVADLDTLKFAGLDGVTFSNYQPGMNYAPAEDPYVPKVDKKGKPIEGIYEDYMPETYDVNTFVDKAVQSHDRAYRTDNYVSTFDDGASFAATKASGDAELGTADISKPDKQQPSNKSASKSSRADRVAQAESLLPSGSNGKSAEAEYDS